MVLASAAVILAYGGAVRGLADRQVAGRSGSTSSCWSSGWLRWPRRRRSSSWRCCSPGGARRGRAGPADLREGESVDPADRQPPDAYGVGGGPIALHLDGRQVEEFLLTATQTLLGLAVLLSLRFPRWAAWTLLGLFAVQFAVPGQTGRYVLSAIYLVLAIVAVVHNRQYVVATLTSPFRRTEKPADADRADELLNA